MMSSSDKTSNSITTTDIKLTPPKSGWRVALNIGRETTTKNMPPSWASSGARLPIVIPCDFSLEKNEFIPKEEIIRFTGPNGEVKTKINRGTWSLKQKTNELSFEFEFPEQFSRRDVTIESSSTLRCEGKLFSISELKQMDTIFYEARDETFAAEETVKDIKRRKNAPRKWNDESSEWETRYKEETNLSQVLKKMQLVRVKQQEKFKSGSRPLPKDLSLDCGPFPGIPDDVYMLSGGVLKMKQGLFRPDIVIGTWSAEPITDKPKSYYG